MPLNSPSQFTTPYSPSQWARFHHQPYGLTCMTAATCMACELAAPRDGAVALHHLGPQVREAGLLRRLHARSEPSGAAFVDMSMIFGDEDAFVGSGAANLPAEAVIDISQGIVSRGVVAQYGIVS